MADSKDKKIGEVPHLEQVTGKEKIPVSAEGEPRYIETAQIYDKEVTPYPKANQIVYTTTDGEVIELADANLVSNVYYKDKGYGVMTFEEDLVECPSFHRNPKADKFKSIILPEGMTKFDNYNFSGCSSLSDVYLPSSLTMLGGDSFRDCTSLLDIYIPSGVKNIGDSCFNGCTNLRHINLSEKCYIGGAAFEGCINLQSIIFPSVSQLRNRTFNNCRSLKEFIVPNTVTEILNEVFKNCISLTHITIPQSVTSIGNNAFANVTPFYFDTYLPNTQGWPAVNKLQTLILRYDGVVKDVDTYAGTFAKEPIAIPEASTLDLVDSPMPIDGAEPMPMSDIEGGIMPMLNTYVGTPNNWLKIYVPENRLKEYQETYPTLKSHFHPITGEDIYATRDDLSKSKKDLFIDLWNEACIRREKATTMVYGKYNEETGFFELNGLLDLSYDNAIEIYNRGRMTNSDANRTYAVSKIRTNIPPLTSSAAIVMEYTCADSPELEVFNGGAGWSTPSSYAFGSCPKLKRVFGIGILCNATTAYFQCYMLEDVEFIYLANNVNPNFKDCPLLNLDTFRRIEKAKNFDNPLTVTVHPDVFAKLTDPENAEWYQLNQDATEKNIQFATA